MLASVRDEYCKEFYKYYLHDFVRNVHKSHNKKQEQAETEYKVGVMIIIIIIFILHIVIVMYALCVQS